MPLGKSPCPKVRAHPRRAVGFPSGSSVPLRLLCSLPLELPSASALLTLGPPGEQVAAGLCASDSQIFPQPVCLSPELKPTHSTAWQRAPPGALATSETQNVPTRTLPLLKWFLSAFPPQSRHCPPTGTPPKAGGSPDLSLPLSSQLPRPEDLSVFPPVGFSDPFTSSHVHCQP